MITVTQLLGRLDSISRELNELSGKTISGQFSTHELVSLIGDIGLHVDELIGDCDDDGE